MPLGSQENTAGKCWIFTPVIKWGERLIFLYRGNILNQNKLWEGGFFFLKNILNTLLKKSSTPCSVGLPIFREKLFPSFNTRSALNPTPGLCVPSFTKLTPAWLTYLSAEGERERYLNNWEDIFCLSDKVTYMYIYIAY